MIKAFIVDRVGFRTTAREYTDEGFLLVPGRVARIGIQDYLASELGLKDRAPTEIVRVYRPPEEVFNTDSLASYENKDVTDDHPPEMVSAANYKALTVGHVAGVASQDGDYVVAKLVIKDAETIKKVDQAGKAQLSAGYTAEYEDAPGETADGEPYDFIQRNIKINHVALVDRARAGSMARVFDKHSGVTTMKITLDNGRAIEVQSEAEAALVQDSLQRLKDKAADAETKLKQKTKDADTMQAKVDAMDEELKELKKRTSDKAIKDRIAEIQTTLDRARKIVGKEFTSDSIEPAQIKREALEALKKNVTDKSDDYVAAAFDMAEEKEAEDEEEEEAKKKEAKDALTAIGSDLAKLDVKDAQAARENNYDSFLQKRYGKAEA